MYREAIEHLMAAPTQTDPLQADESTNPVETPDSGGQRASSFEDGDCFMENAEGAHGIRTGLGCQGGHSAPVGGGQQYSFSSNRQDELVASCGGVPTTSSSARRLRKGANMHVSAYPNCFVFVGRWMVCTFLLLAVDSSSEK